MSRRWSVLIEWKEVLAIVGAAIVISNRVTALETAQAVNNETQQKFQHELAGVASSVATLAGDVAALRGEDGRMDERVKAIVVQVNDIREDVATLTEWRFRR